YIRTHKPFRERKNEFETSLAGIHFVVGSHHYVNGKLKVSIRCTARIHDIYLQSTERSIDEDRPRVISAASSANSNGNVVNGNAVQYDHFPPYAENELDRKDYMTHLQGDMAASGSSPTARPTLPSTSLNSIDHFRPAAINHFRWAFGPLTVLLLPFAHPLLSSLLNRLSTVSLRA
uniref:Uncharacterized protein n=1 Tax=Anopheles christyi TaxID=43041 RepID=A0A182KBT4_9DIPT